MKLITRTQLIALLMEVKSATFATLTLNTEPTMRKTGNPYVGQVRKIAIHNVTLNASYEKSVARQQGREGLAQDFKAQERAWGTHESAAVIENKGSHYVQAKLEKTLSSIFISSIDNKPIDAAELAPFIPAKPEVKTQNVEKKVIVFSPKVDNIVAVSMLGENYQVIAG